MGRRRLIKRESAVHRKPDPARHDRFPEIRAHHSDDLANFRKIACAKGRAHIVESLEGVQVQIEFGLDAPESANIDHPTQNCGGFHAAVYRRAGYHVDNHVSTLTVRGPKNLIDPTWIARIDDKISPKLGKPLRARC